jgi:dynein intermediate chain 2
MPVTSYIWDVNNPNDPDQELVPYSPLCCLVYNPKSADHLVGGSYNGNIGLKIIHRDPAARPL